MYSLYIVSFIVTHKIGYCIHKIFFNLWVLSYLCYCSLQALRSKPGANQSPPETHHIMICQLSLSLLQAPFFWRSLSSGSRADHSGSSGFIPCLRSAYAWHYMRWFGVSSLPFCDFIVVMVFTLHWTVLNLTEVRCNFTGLICNELNCKILIQVKKKYLRFSPLCI